MKETEIQEQKRKMEIARQRLSQLPYLEKGDVEFLINLARGTSLSASSALDAICEDHLAFQEEVLRADINYYTSSRESAVKFLTGYIQNFLAYDYKSPDDVICRHLIAKTTEKDRLMQLQIFRELEHTMINEESEAA